MKGERYDVVVVGGGPNGLGIAAYLAKAGLKVCVCEERNQVGGGAENTEPIPGFRIDPHATYLYGAAAPAFEQLELWRYGFRMRYYRTLAGTVTLDGKAIIAGRFNVENTMKSIERYSKKDTTFASMIFGAKLEKELVAFLRSIYWTPPYTHNMWSESDDLPWMKVLKEKIPFLYEFIDPEKSTYEIIDDIAEFEPLKVVVGQGAWYNGPHPAWRGMGIFGLSAALLMFYSSGSPLGGMHSYMHTLLRCALAHGTKVLTNSSVEEIIVEGGEVKGVVLSESSPAQNKVILADRFVVSAVDVKQTFLKLIGPKYLDKGFLQNVKDISLKGGSLFVLHLIVRELPKYKGDAGEVFAGENYPSVVVLPGDSREYVMNQTRDIYSKRTHPKTQESCLIMVCCHDIYDRTRCPEGYHVLSPIYIQVPPPEYHIDGPEAVNKAKDEIIELMLNCLAKFAPNMTRKNIIAMFVNTPYDSELRNVGFIGGNWYATRHCEDQWWSYRPLPELVRYRTPIHKLYLCHQTSYPGGLCLMAVPYNLMHILIDDGMLKAPDWWYPSPWHIKEEG